MLPSTEKHICKAQFNFVNYTICFHVNANRKQMPPRLRASLFDGVFLGLEYAICLTFFGLCIIFKRSLYQLCHESLRILFTRLMKSLKSFLQCGHLGRFNRQVFHLWERHNFNSKFPCQTTSLILSQHGLQNQSSKAG